MFIMRMLALLFGTMTQTVSWEEYHQNSWFARDIDWEIDCATLASRLKESANAPMIGMANYLPLRDDAHRAMEFNRACRQFLWERAQVDHIHIEEIEEAIADLDRRYSIWNHAWRARIGSYYSRRMDMLRLMEENDDSWVLPPVVPHWRFWPAK